MIKAFQVAGTWARKLRHSAWVRNESGIAAMEFALIAPLIIGLYLGLAELSSLLSVERKISHSASVAGDLATQVEALSSDDAEELVSAVLHVVNMDDLQKFGLRIESFTRKLDGTIASEGEITYQTGGAAVPAFDQSELTMELLPTGSGVVVSSVRYKYAPFGFTYVDGEKKGEGILPSQVNLGDQFIMKPRRSKTVIIGDSGAEDLSCSGTTNSVSCS